MKQYSKTVNGTTVFYQDPLVLDGKQIFNPSEDQLKAAGWEEYTPETPSENEYKPTYEERVVELIRERYTIDDEIALLRQKESKPEEYQAWFQFCEACKEQARNE